MTTTTLPLAHRSTAQVETAAGPGLVTVQRLQPLLHRAAVLDIDDHLGWAQLRIETQDATAELVAADLLPPHFAVATDDPPAVVARTLANAWRRATAPAQLRHLRW